MEADRSETALAPSDVAIAIGLVRSAHIDVLEAIDHLSTICRPRVKELDLHFIDAALAQLRQANARLGMAVGE